MIRLNGDEVKIEHFPDGTQRLNLKRIYEADYSDNDIEWFYEKEEELSALIYIAKHIQNLSYVGLLNLYIHL